MSVAAYAERKTIKDAVPALGKLTMWLWAWGLMMLLTLFCRAIFGTINGTVGWIPFAGRLISSPIHKIEQKVSNYIGGAVQHIDAHIAASFHKLAGIVRDIPMQLLQQAALLLTLAAAVVVLPTQALVRHMIRVATAPTRAAVHDLENALGKLRGGYTRLNHFARHSIWARLAALAALVGGIAHDLPKLRARDRIIEKELAKLRDWVKGRRISLTTGAFLGAFVWALGKLGLRWIRCSKVGKVGKALCSAPTRNIEALLGLLAAVWGIAHIRTVAHYAESISEEVARDLARVAGAGEFPRDRFTIE